MALYCDAKPQLCLQAGRPTVLLRRLLALKGSGTSPIRLIKLAKFFWGGYTKARRSVRRKEIK